MKNFIIAAFCCIGLYTTATAQHTPAPYPDNKSKKTTRHPQVVVVEKDTMPHPVNSSNIVNDPTIRAKLEESPTSRIDDRSRAEKPNANINFDATNQQTNKDAPNSTNSANPNSNAISPDPSYNARTYLDETKSVHRDLPAKQAPQRSSKHPRALAKPKNNAPIDSTQILRNRVLPEKHSDDNWK